MTTTAPRLTISSPHLPDRYRRRAHELWASVRLFRPSGEGWGDISIMFGALSILMFWTFGFGIVLGIAALAAGALAIRDSLEASETPSFDALVGILTGFLGIAAGIFFLVAVSSNF